MKLGILLSFVTAPVWVPTLFAAAAVDEVLGTTIAVDAHAKLSNRTADIDGVPRPYPDA